MNKVLILSGAGLSAESGIRTFRDSNGLWEKYETLYEKIALCRNGLFIAIGTSGQVIDAGGIADYFKYSILNNRDPEPMMDRSFTKVFHENATAAAPKIKELTEKFIKTENL